MKTITLEPCKRTLAVYHEGHSFQKKAALRPLALLGIFFLTSSLSSANPVAGEPQNPKQAAAQNKESVWADLKPDESASYKSWRDTLPADQREWEDQLEKYLGGYYFPRYVRDRNKGVYSLENPGDWGFVVETPGLPNVLILGDSISRSYTGQVRQRLKGRFNVYRVPANAGATGVALPNLSAWIGHRHWDVITFNFGIHDSKFTPPAQYPKNLETIIAKLSVTGARLIWVRTTPGMDATKSQLDPKIDPVNVAADGVMALHPEIAVCDLSSTLMQAPGKLSDYLREDGVHFNDVGQGMMAEAVAKKIESVQDKSGN